MSAVVLKQQVRQAFDGAARSYDAATPVQRAVGQALLLALQAQGPGWQPQRLLDAGCGTGQGAQLLQAAYPAAQLLRLDFAPAMLACAAPGAPLCADLEALPLAPACIDLYWSSMAVQWCDLGRVLQEAARVLAPGGTLALSTLGPATFAALDRAFAQADTHPHRLGFTAPEALAAALAAAGLRLVWQGRAQHSAWYADLASLLRAIKTAGAHTVPGRRSGLLGRRAWQRVQADYERLRQPQGLPAHYDVLSVIACRARA